MANFGLQRHSKKSQHLLSNWSKILCKGPANYTIVFVISVKKGGRMAVLLLSL
jgi:hypothetical protein